MKAITKQVFNKGVILLIGILVAFLLMFSSFNLTNSIVQKQSKIAPSKGISLIQQYIYNS